MMLGAARRRALRHAPERSILFIDAYFFARFECWPLGLLLDVLTVWCSEEGESRRRSGEGRSGGLPEVTSR